MAARVVGRTGDARLAELKQRAERFPKDAFEGPNYGWELLQTMIGWASPNDVSAVLKQLQTNTEVFARKSQPGHEVWYPIHLRREILFREAVGSVYRSIST